MPVTRDGSGKLDYYDTPNEHATLAWNRETDELQLWSARDDWGIIETAEEAEMLRDFLNEYIETVLAKRA